MIRAAKGIKNHKIINIFLRFGVMWCAVFVLAIGSAQIAKAATFTVSNINDSGAGSLRQAIIDANNTAGADLINFSTGGTIIPSTPLPAITDMVTIDGYTAPGSAVNSDSNFSNAVLTVELNGSNAGDSGIGLQISAGNCTVSGLAINRFREAGIRIDTGTGTTLSGNFIGTDLSGTAALGNFNRGVLIVGSTGNIIGKTAIDSRNVISGNFGNGISIAGGGSATIRRALIGTDKSGTVTLGNTRDGILIADSSNSVIGVQGNSTGRNIISGNNGSGISIIQSSSTTSATNNIIANNYIGVDVSGIATKTVGAFTTSTVSNSGSGVLINAAGNTVGGITTSGTSVARNIISGNRASGVSISSNYASANTVSGNYIGVGANGTTAIGNRDNGVQISNLATNNTVGGTGVTAGACDNSCNVIANNGDPANSTSARAGVYVDLTGSSGNKIRGNSIFNNNGIGIDLGAVGSTANDAGDPDTGPNNLQNFPSLTAADTNGGITGTLNSTANTTFAVDFYNNTTTDGASSEGRVFIGSTNVTTDGGGDVTFSYGTTSTLTAGQFITATATSTGGSAQAVGDTSEFSAPRLVTAASGGAQGIEADVAPRAATNYNGDGSVTISDVQQLLRFQTGADSNYQSNEFQRADCAPRNPAGNSGDGAVTISDVQQALRYQSGADPQQAAGGPTAPTGGTPVPSPLAATMLGIGSKVKTKNAPAGAARTLRVVGGSGSAGQTVTVQIVVDNASGTERGFGFSLNYDNRVLTYNSATLGADAPAANSFLQVNPRTDPNDANNGQLGVGILFSSDFPAGSGKQLLVLQFTIANGATAAQTTPITFGDAPAKREVTDVNAMPLVPTFYQDGSVTILGTTAAGVEVGGRVENGRGRGVAKAQVVMTNSQGETRTARSNAFGYFKITDVPSGETYTVFVKSKLFKFTPKVINLTQNLDDVNFIAQP